MKHHLFSLGIFILLICFVYRSLLLNVSTNLPDWLDYALVNWLIFQNVDKIINFNFVNFFDTNAFYPHKDTLFFADTFLPQALIATPFYLLTKNYILSFNLTFFITFVLNYFSAYLFWKQIFKKYFIAITGGLLVVFSPFYHLERSHFQMLSYWPFFLSLLFIFKYESGRKLSYLIIGSIFFAIQFLASVYIFIFLAFSVLFYYFIQFFKPLKKIPVLKSLLILFTIFIFIDGIFIKGYYDMKHEYNFQRDFKEYITYSANLTDYIFTNRIDSTLYSFPLFKLWNSLDKNTLWGSAQFPGFLVTLLAFFSLFRFIKDDKEISIRLTLTNKDFFFFAIMIMGFIFSLGPRIIFNNTYSHIPAPYALFLKFIPFLESIRAVCRWSFLFYFGLIYFCLISLNKIKIFSKLLFLTILLLIILEYIPLDLSTHSEDILTSDYLILQNLCLSQKKVLLEIPITHLDVYPSIGDGVNYISKVEFSSLYHKCYLVNGYSGYDLPELFTLKNNLYTSMLNIDSKTFIKTAKDARADIIKINSNSLPREIFSNLTPFLNKLSAEESIIVINKSIYLLK